jgi:hypothetical protein
MIWSNPALLEKVYELAKHNLEYVEFNGVLSNLDVGVLTEGFDQLNHRLPWYNHPYYATYSLRIGLC